MEKDPELNKKRDKTKEASPEENEVENEKQKEYNSTAEKVQKSSTSISIQAFIASLFIAILLNGLLTFIIVNYLRTNWFPQYIIVALIAIILFPFVKNFIIKSEPKRRLFIKIFSGILALSIIVTIIAGLYLAGRKNLYRAVYKGDTKAAIALINRGHDVNKKSKNGFTILMAAAAEGRAEIVKVLIDNGADVNAKTTNGGWTALLYAINPGHNFEIVKLLIENGADVNPKTETSLSNPLMLATMFGYAEIVKVLIDNGADVNAKDKDGRTALTWAKDEEIIALLKKAGAK